jgi:hypothetical protein
LSPILVRPVREQLEHDRLIRLLHTKFRRKYDAGMNPGNEQNAPVGVGPAALFPDIVLSSPDRSHRLQTVLEVETGESVNHLEALAQWAHYGKTRAAFHLYVPANMIDVARRLCEDNQIQVSEIWSYHMVGDEPRFTMVHRNRDVTPPRAAPKPAAPQPAAKAEAPAPRQAAGKKAPAPAKKAAASRKKPAARAPKPAKAKKTAKAVKKKKK